MKQTLIILFVSIFYFFTGCKSQEEKPVTSDEQRQNQVLPPGKITKEQIQKQQNIEPKIAAEIIELIKENLAATQAEDKERVLNTIHKDCPQMKSTKQGMDYVFANYNMVYNLEEAEVIEVLGEEAKVYYVQTTRSQGGQGFPPSRSSGYHILKKENGKWKIFKTEYLSNEQIQ
ncbi:MAG: hypothetical protein ACHQLA_03305 [Ignavibacteriales bacterium]